MVSNECFCSTRALFTARKCFSIYVESNSKAYWISQVKQKLHNFINILLTFSILFLLFSMFWCFSIFSLLIFPILFWYFLIYFFWFYNRIRAQRNRPKSVTSFMLSHTFNIEATMNPLWPGKTTSVLYSLNEAIIQKTKYQK